MMRPAVLCLIAFLSPVLLAAQATSPQTPSAPPTNSQKTTTTPDDVAPPSSPPARTIYIPARTGPGSNYENWNVEFTAGAWMFSPSGTVTSQSVANNMKNDLGIEGWKTQPLARVTLQLDRNKLIIEGTQYRLFGAKTIDQPVTVDGRTVSLDDETQANVKITYGSLAYERDLFSGRHGFFGLTGGLVYLQTKSELDDDTRMLSQVNHQTGVLPVGGGAFRYFPLHTYFFNVNGETRGLNFRNYGFYLQSSANLGVSPTRHFTIQAGYSRLGMDLHTKYEVSGIRTVFKGPTASLQWRFGG